MPSPPHPDPIEDILYRIHVIFQEPDGRLWSAGTDLMGPNMQSAEAMAEDLNSRLGLDYAALTAFAKLVFAAKRMRPDSSKPEPFETPE